MRALAFSPHLDDAAFSCGGTLARLAREGWDVTVATVFTRSVPEPTGFALACQLDKGLAPDVDYMAIRRDEDAEACARLGARPLWLGLPEAPHRGYGSARALFASPRADDNVVAPLGRMIAALLDPMPELLLAPQAIGGHVDHVMVLRALRDVLPPTLPVLWWTDFPYAARPHSHPAQPFARDFDSMHARSIAGDAAARLAACTAYATQIGFQFGGVTGLARALDEAGAVERFREHGRVRLTEAA